MNEYYYLILLAAIGIISIYYLFHKKSIIGEKSNHESILNLFSRNLTELAKLEKLDPVIGREKEIKKTIEILCRRTKNNPVLLGKAGVGKTAVVEGLAQAIIKGKVPDIIKNKKVLSLDLSAVVAGTKYRGEFEERLKKIVNEIISREREIILFIDEIHSISEAGKAEGAINAVDILKPALARGELQIIGATTIQEYKNFIEPDITLERRFHPIIIHQPSRQETIKILRGIKEKYEQFHHVEIPNALIDNIVDMASDIKGRVYPDKAIDLMDEAAAKVSLHLINNADSKNKATIDLRVIKKIHDEWIEVNKSI